MKLLIVDDIQANIIALEAIINEYISDVNIDTSLNGSDALKKAISGDLDLILLDIRMPDMDGFEVAEILQSNKTTRSIPIIFLTAEYKEKEFQERGYEVGAIAYLTKPINEVQIINMLKMHQRMIKQSQELQNMNDVLEERIEREVSTRREQDKMLFQEHKMAQMGEMLSMIAHQWRQPLTSVSSVLANVTLNIQLNEEKIKSNPKELDECISYVEDSMGKASSYISDLSQVITDFSNFYKKVDNWDKCKIDEPISNTLEMLDGTLKTIDLEIDSNFSSTRVLKISLNEIMQVFLCIFQNSYENFVEKSIKEPKITIVTRDLYNGVEVEIFDNGGGIDATVIEKIFDPYFSTKQEKNGTGIGLYMAKKILEEHHNGVIEVSNAENGVCFNIIFTL